METYDDKSRREDLQPKTRQPKPPKKPVHKYDGRRRGMRRLGLRKGNMYGQ